MLTLSKPIRALFALGLTCSGLTDQAIGQCERGTFHHPQVAQYTRFGNSLATDGRRIIIGAPTGSGSSGLLAGSVIIYSLEEGSVTLESTLTPGEQDMELRFGTDVDIDGDRAIATSRNMVHFIQRDPLSGHWTGTQQIPITGNRHDRLACAIQGDVAVVGAAFDDTHGPDAGLATVYRFDGQVFVEASSLERPGGVDSFFLGGAVDISGSRIAVGALIGEFEGRIDLVVLTYRRSGRQWIPESTVVIEESRVMWMTPWLTLHGAEMIAGYPSHTAGIEQVGAAFIYRFRASKSTWRREATLTASEGAAFDFLGVSTAIEGNVALVGATNVGDETLSLNRVHVFNRRGNSWAETGILLPTDREPAPDFNFAFGASVALTNGRVFVGAPGDDQFEHDAGSVYEFVLSGSDCDANGRCDVTELADGTSRDANADGIPDGCEREAGDIDRDGAVGVTDFLLVLTSWGACRPPCSADTDHDGLVGIEDFLTVLYYWS